jgi:multiple sugar transport system substrate-binding protein
VKMKKWSSLLASSLLTLSVVVSGCSSQPAAKPADQNKPADNSKPADNAANGEKITLSYWDTFSGAELDLMTQMIADYEKSHPNIKIDKFDIPFDQRGIKIQAAAQANDLPDILRSDYPDNMELTKMGKLLDLKKPLEDMKWDGLTDIPKIIWDTANYKDNLTVIPQDRFEYVVYYNKKLFADAGIKEFPKTWDEFIDASKKLTKDGHFALATRNIEWEVLSYTAGAKWFDKDGNLKVDTPEWEKGLQLYTDLFTKYKVQPPATPSYGYGEEHSDWNSGKAAMMISGSWEIENTKKDAPNIDFGIAPLPAGPGGKATNLNTTPWMIPKQSKHQKEALDFILWMESKENVMRWAKTLNHIPIRTSVANDPYFQKDMFKPFLEANEIGVPQVELIRRREIDKAIKDGIQAVYLGQKTIKQVLEEAQKVADAVWAKEKN